MGKHTSKEFLYDREHVRVWKCRKTGTKVRSKSGPKTGPGQHPKHRKHRYTGISSLQHTSKRGSKMAPKMMGTSKIASGTTGPRRPLSRAGISLNSIWRPIFKNPQKGGQFPKNRMKQAISGAITDRKRTMKMGVKNQPKNDGTIAAAINHKTTVRLTSRAQYQSSPVPVQISLRSTNTSRTGYLENRKLRK